MVLQVHLLREAHTPQRQEQVRALPGEQRGGFEALHQQHQVLRGVHIQPEVQLLSQLPQRQRHLQAVRLGGQLFVKFQSKPLELHREAEHFLQADTLQPEGGRDDSRDHRVRRQPEDRQPQGAQGAQRRTVRHLATGDTLRRDESDGAQGLQVPRGQHRALLETRFQELPQVRGA